VSPAAARILTIVAASALAFDGTALLGLGVWKGRVGAILAGVVFLVSSGLVLFYWRWYRRRLEDLAAARRALSDEAREIQRLLRER
jgi:hypothetical protein